MGDPFNYFESRTFTLKPGNADHPSRPAYGNGGDASESEYISAWNSAEMSRVRNAANAIADAEKLEGCPSYGKQ